MCPFGDIDAFPVGVNPPKPKKNITKVSGGDTIIFRDFICGWDGKPVTYDNSILSFCLRDQKFSDEAVWTGGWRDGIELENNNPGHVIIKVPDIVSWSLRRGSFVHSLLVADKLFNNRRTYMRGSLLVEYEATSPQLSIPYKDGADSSQSYQHVSNDLRYITGINIGDSTYSPGKSGIIYLPELGSSTLSKSCVLPCGDDRYKLHLKLVDGVIVSYWVKTYDDLSPVAATFDGVTYYMRLKNVDGVLTSYWEKVVDAT